MVSDQALHSLGTDRPNKLLNRWACSKHRPNAVTAIAREAVKMEVFFTAIYILNCIYKGAMC